MNKKIVFSLIALCAITAHAQFREIELIMSKGKQKGISIPVKGTDREIAFEAVGKTIADKDSKVDPTIISFQELFFDNAILTSISLNPIDVYARFNETDTSLLLFVDLGSSFVNAATTPNEALAVQKLGLDIQNKVKVFLQRNAIDTLKKQIKLLEDNMERVSDELKAANNYIKGNNKSAAKDDKQVTKTETRLQDTKSQIIETDSLIYKKQKEFDGFPLLELKSENKMKNQTLKDNRKAFKKMVRANANAQDDILQYQVDMALNKAKLELVGEDKKAVKKIVKSDNKLKSKIDTEKANIDANYVKMKLLNESIVADSSKVKANEDRLGVFNEDGRKRELKQLASKKAKLEGKTVKQQTDINENKQESEQKRKDAEAAEKKVADLKIQQQAIKIELDAARIKLAEMEAGLKAIDNPTK